MITRSEDRSNENDNLNDRNKHMYQTILSAKKIDSQIIQELNDKKKIQTIQSYFCSVKSNQSIRKILHVLICEKSCKKTKNRMMKCYSKSSS